MFTALETAKKQLGVCSEEKLIREKLSTDIEMQNLPTGVFFSLTWIPPPPPLPSLY